MLYAHGQTVPSHWHLHAAGLFGNLAAARLPSRPGYSMPVSRSMSDALGDQPAGA
jgi:hypothetical protein